jgi:hypothetical protein
MHYYLYPFEPLCFEWKWRNVDEDAGEVDEGQQQKGGERPDGRQDDDDGIGELDEGPREDMEDEEDNGESVGHGCNSCADNAAMPGDLTIWRSDDAVPGGGCSGV